MSKKTSTAWINKRQSQHTLAVTEDITTKIWRNHVDQATS